MALVRMAMENYRCFKERQEIELRPLTIILGKNNSGKSAITRLPLILETGIRTRSRLPLDLDKLEDDPPEFLDLVHGRNVHRPIRFGMSVEGDGPAVDLQVAIQNVDERKSQFVSRIDVKSGKRRISAAWEPGNSADVYSLVTSPGTESSGGSIDFRGFLPRARRNFGETLLSTLSREANAVFIGFDQIRYLGAYRERPSRLTRLPSRHERVVGVMGENAAGMIVNDQVRGGGALIEQVNFFIGDNLMGWRLEVEPQGPVYSINLRSTADPSLSVNLLDSGTGVGQVLPMLVQQAQDRVEPPEEDTLQIIEEPELHLHPAFHALLADLLIASLSDRVRFLIETHSETLLLRLRRRITEGRISPDDVAVYFVDHSEGTSEARRIHIDELGNLDYWPSGVFSEDFEETKKLAEAQFARGRDEG